MQKRTLRRYGNRSAMVLVERDVQVKVVVDRPMMAIAIGPLGSRVYSTNTPSKQLSIVQAELA